MADDNAPTLDDRRTKATFDLFKELNYLRGGAAGGDAAPELTINDVERLDVEKMKAHILDCLAAVCEAQRVRVAQKQPMKLREDGEALTPEQQEARNKVFVAALKEVATGLTHDGASHDSPSYTSAETLLYAFPDNSKLADGRGWLPMHWAVAIDRQDNESEVTKADVISMYEADPMALRQHHLITLTDKKASWWTFGSTPAHMLCGLEMTEKNMSLVRHFSVLDPRAFTMKAVDNAAALHGHSALHVACYNPYRTEALLRLLVQLDPSQMKSITERGGPLGLLCLWSYEFDERLLGCLLEADSSAEVVYDAVNSCFLRPYEDRVLFVAKLLEVNPAAAQHKDEDGRNLAHQACIYSDNMDADEYIEVLKLVLARNKDVLKEADNFGQLPAHVVAKYGPASVLDFVLGEYPGAAALVDSKSHNLLHLVAIFEPEEHRAAKARLLCACHPDMMLQRDGDGSTPLLQSCVSKHAATTLLLCKAGGRRAASISVAHPTNSQFEWNGDLPLHWLIDEDADTLKADPLSATADAFRLLLRLYPEAAGTEGGVGADKETPYDVAVEHDLPVYYRRLLLCAAPDLDPAELRRLNWAERRMAMFVAFVAVAKTPSVLVRLRAAENKDVLKHVVSFL